MYKLRKETDINSIFLIRCYTLFHMLDINRIHKVFTHIYSRVTEVFDVLRAHVGWWFTCDQEHCSEK